MRHLLWYDVRCHFSLPVSLSEQDFNSSSLPRAQRRTTAEDMLGRGTVVSGKRMVRSKSLFFPTCSYHLILIHIWSPSVLNPLLMVTCAFSMNHGYMLPHTRTPSIDPHSYSLVRAPYRHLCMTLWATQILLRTLRESLAGLWPPPHNMHAQVCMLAVIYNEYIYIYIYVCVFKWNQLPFTESFMWNHTFSYAFYPHIPRTWEVLCGGKWWSVYVCNRSQNQCTLYSSAQSICGERMGKEWLTGSGNKYKYEPIY